ncbi:MAG: inositol monophosphatase [Victivallaceae bacterium]|nr:inositol monophosphatase [Victivallaceae bacterium]
MLDFISELVQRAGELACKRRRTLSSAQIHTKTTETDLVTDVDREVESFIIGELRRRTPDYGIYGEESGKEHADAPFCWVIDPIDGTTNFIRDLPFYCVSIGLRRRGEGVLGAVFAPKLGELFLAEKGKGATCNGQTIRVSDVGDLSRAVVATGFSCIRAKRKFDNLVLLPPVAHAVCAFRRSGSAAIDLCYVGAGKLDAFWELALAPYDIAAGETIVREAGGIVTDLEGNANYPQRGTLAGNPAIHPEMLDFFRPGTGISFR